jgi:hypothetical protein
MAPKATKVYRLTRGRLQELCAEVGIESDAPVCVLRQRYMEDLRGVPVVEIEQFKMEQTAQANGEASGSPSPEDLTQVGSIEGSVAVLVELLRGVPPLSSDSAEDIL